VKTDGLSDRGDDELRIAHRSEGHDHKTVDENAFCPVGRFEGEPGFSDSAWSGNRDQALIWVGE